MKNILPIICFAAILTSCATAQDYGTVVRTETDKYNITSSASSAKEATKKALKAAELSCKEAKFTGGYIVNSQENKYNGMLASQEQQAVVSGILKVASVLDTSKNNTAKSLNNSISEDAYQTYLKITCQK
ncbi:hypothetical protein Dip510_000611 [Elusimicrobium posterum]|uniref:hypothetical protein n=1 Tax=Elusimicrobium posterum TaxID=3116653 RepID=UPI003C74DC86